MIDLDQLLLQFKSLNDDIDINNTNQFNQGDNNHHNNNDKNNPDPHLLHDVLTPTQQYQHIFPQMTAKAIQDTCSQSIVQFPMMNSSGNGDLNGMAAILLHSRFGYHIKAGEPTLIPSLENTPFLPHNVNENYNVLNPFFPFNFTSLTTMPTISKDVIDQGW